MQRDSKERVKNIKKTMDIQISLLKVMPFITDLHYIVKSTISFFYLIGQLRKLQKHLSFIVSITLLFFIYTYIFFFRLPCFVFFLFFWFFRFLNVLVRSRSDVICCLFLFRSILLNICIRI